MASSKQKDAEAGMVYQMTRGDGGITIKAADLEQMLFSTKTEVKGDLR